MTILSLKYKKDVWPFPQLGQMLLTKPKQIVLASSSPRRQELLSNLGVKFEIFIADIDESIKENETPQVLVERLSNSKAACANKKYSESLIIAADTVVVFQGDILGKPRDTQENYSFIEKLSGQTHEVYTGYTLSFKEKKILSSLKSKVTFRNLSYEEIAQYVSTNEGMDKAGGYAIQGFGASIVKNISGCYFNIVGLSLSHILEEAKKLGVYFV